MYQFVECPPQGEMRPTCGDGICDIRVGYPALAVCRIVDGEVVMQFDPTPPGLLLPVFAVAAVVGVAWFVAFWYFRHRSQVTASMNQRVAVVLGPVVRDEVTYVFRTEPWMKPIPIRMAATGVAPVGWYGVDLRRRRGR